MPHMPCHAMPAKAKRDGIFFLLHFRHGKWIDVFNKKIFIYDVVWENKVTNIRQDNIHWLKTFQGINRWDGLLIWSYFSHHACCEKEWWWVKWYLSWAELLLSLFNKASFGVLKCALS
jgi:hypothetical protein